MHRFLKIIIVGVGVIILCVLLWFLWVLRITVPLGTTIYENEYLSFEYPSDFIISRENVIREHELRGTSSYDMYGLTTVSLERANGLPFTTILSAFPRADWDSGETEVVYGEFTNLLHMKKGGYSIELEIVRNAFYVPVIGIDFSTYENYRMKHFFKVFADTLVVKESN